jgi:hypothetical protein
MPDPTNAMPGQRDAGANRAVLLLALFATLFAAYFGLYVTPLGDIPDESGHYSYVRDVASGTFWPLMEESTFYRGLWGEEAAAITPSERANYIVQHPPGFYAVAAIPHAAGAALGLEPWWLYRLPRLISALALGLLLLVLHALLREVGVARGRALPLIAGLALLPMLVQLASGITNDVFLFLLCALATLFLVRFVRRQHITDAYWCALWLTLAGGTKMTAWVFLAPALLILLYELRAPLGLWLRHAFGLSALALALPAWWMGRNVVHFGWPFYRAGYGELSAPALDRAEAPFLQMLAEQPVMNWLFAHFHGLFGFSGYCQTPELSHLCSGILMTQLFGFSRNAYTLVLAALVLMFLLYLLRLVWQSLRRAEPPDPTYCLGGPPRSLAEVVGDWLGGSRVRWPWMLLMLAAGLLVSVGLLGLMYVDFDTRADLLSWQAWLARRAEPLLIAGGLALLAYLLSVLLRRRSADGGQPLGPLVRVRADLRALRDAVVPPGADTLRVALPQLLLTLLGGLAVAFAIDRLFSGQALGDLQVLLMSLAPLAALMAVGLLLLPQTAIDRIAIYGPILFVFFGSVLLLQIYQGYLLTGVPRGVQGRYLYPVMPLLLVALGVALQRLRVPYWLCLGLLVLLGLAFADAFIERVLPFYLEARV